MQANLVGLKLGAQAAIWLCIVCAVGCGQPRMEPPPATALLRVAGSTSMEPLLRELADTYRRQHPHIQFDLITVGSAAGLELLHRGETDLAAVSRQLTREEQVDPRTGLPLLVTWTIAHDTIAVIVHADSVLDKASLQVIQQVFAGRIWDWRELGGAPGDVTVVSREHGSATRAVFEELVMRGNLVTQAAVIMPSSSAVRDYVAGHEGAIGYVSLAFADAGVKALKVDGARTDSTAQLGGESVAKRPFVLALLPDAKPAAVEFSAWVVSAAGKAVIAQQYSLPDADLR